MYKIQQAEEEESINAYTFHSKIATIWGFIITIFPMSVYQSVYVKRGKKPVANCLTILTCSFHLNIL